MKKRILATLVTLSMVFTMLPTVALAATTVYTPTGLSATTDDGRFRLEWDAMTPADDSGMKIAFFDASGNEVYSDLSGAYSWRNYWELDYNEALEQGLSATSVGIHIAEMSAYGDYSYDFDTDTWTYTDTSGYWAGLTYADYTIVPNAAVIVNYIEESDTFDVTYSYDGVYEYDGDYEPYVGFAVENLDDILSTAQEFELGYMCSNYELTEYDFVSRSGYFSTSRAAYIVQDYWSTNNGGWSIGLGDGSTNYLDYLVMTYSTIQSGNLYTQTFTKYDAEIDFAGYEALDMSGTGDKPTGITIATGQEVDDAAGGYTSSEWFNSMTEPILTWDQAADDDTDGTANWYPNDINPDTDGITRETRLDVYYSDGVFTNSYSICQYWDIVNFRGNDATEYRVSELRLGYTSENEDWTMSVYTPYMPDILVKQVIGETKDIVLNSTDDSEGYPRYEFRVAGFTENAAADFTYMIDGSYEYRSGGGVGNQCPDSPTSYSTTDSFYNGDWTLGLGDGYQEGEEWFLDIYATEIVDNGSDPDGYIVTITRYPLNVVLDDRVEQTLAWNTEGDMTATYGDTVSGYTATNTSEGGGAITYSSSDETVATVDETTGEVTIEGVGETIITATAEDVEDLYRATGITYNLEITPKEIDLTVADSEMAFGDTFSSNLEIAAIGLVGSDAVSDLGITLSATSNCVGTSAYAATLDNANYTVGTVTGTLTITKATAPELDDLAVGVLYTGVYEVAADTTLVLPEDCGTVTINDYYTVSDDCAIIYAVRINGAELSIDVLAGEIGDTATIEAYVSMQNYEDATVNVVITLEDEPVVDDDSDAGSGDTGNTGGTGGSTTSSPTITVEDDTVSITATTSTSGSTVTATVTEATITAALEAADSDDDITVEITVATKTSTSTLDVNLSSEALQAMVDGDVATLTISSDLGTVSLGSEALTSLMEQAGDDDITISIVEIDTEDVLNDAQLAAVGDAPVYDISILCNGQLITHFDGGVLSITFPYILQDGESAENIVVWYIDDLGNITPVTTVYDPEAGTVTFKTVHLSIYAIIHDTNPFTDVDPNAYYYDAVLWAVENGITAGISDTLFAPDASCTRAQAVTFLWRAAGEPVVEAENPFVDVDADAYYYDAVLWAISEGITTGTSETSFSPDATCTRDQIVTFLYRVAGEPEVSGDCSFTDVDTDAYYYSAVLWAVDNEVTSGTSATSFSPSNNCTRGQIVTFLYRNMAE